MYIHLLTYLCGQEMHANKIIYFITQFKKSKLAVYIFNLLISFFHHFHLWRPEVLTWFPVSAAVRWAHHSCACLTRYRSHQQIHHWRKPVGWSASLCISSHLKKKKNHNFWPRSTKKNLTFLVVFYSYSLECRAACLPTWFYIVLAQLQVWTQDYKCEHKTTTSMNMTITSVKTRQLQVWTR